MGEGRLSVGRSAGSFHHWVSPLPWQHLVFWADWFYIILLFSVKMVCQILNFIAMESFYVIDAYQLNYFAKPYVWLFCFIVNLLSHCRRGGWCWGHWQALNLQVMCNLVGDWYCCVAGYQAVASRRWWPSVLFHVCIVMAHSCANIFQGQDLHYFLNVEFSCFKQRISSLLSAREGAKWLPSYPFP